MAIANSFQLKKLNLAVLYITSVFGMVHLPEDNKNKIVDPINKV